MDNNTSNLESIGPDLKCKLLWNGHLSSRHHMKYSVCSATTEMAPLKRYSFKLYGGNKVSITAGSKAV